MMKSKFLFFILFLTSINCYAQTDSSTFKIEHTIAKLMDLISIEKGETMDTAAIRKLFHPSARFSVLMPGDTNILESIYLNDFLEMLKDPYYEDGYYEIEVNKKMNIYGNIAHVFQRFYGKDSQGSTELGMNSYQLIQLNNKWVILNMLWTLD